MKERTTIEQHLQRWAGEDTARQQVSDIVKRLTDTTIAIAGIVAQGSLDGSPGAVLGENTDGDEQKELDLIANDLLFAALQGAPVAYILSEELDEAIEIDGNATLSVAFDPLDGSSNIDTNLSIGTIFSVFQSAEGINGSRTSNILQQGTRQLAAGYVIYGPQTALVITVGEGTHIFTFCRKSRLFLLTTANVSIPEKTREFAINVSNFRHWDHPIRTYIDDCLDGDKGLRDGNFNMRWIASLVAECHRILSRGGIFLYPKDKREGYQLGRLRLIYEAQPISWVIEQAGGGATTGFQAITDVQPTDIHQRVPFIFGSREEVARVERYYAEPHVAGTPSPLFAERGLFRA